MLFGGENIQVPWEKKKKNGTGWRRKKKKKMKFFPKNQKGIILFQLIRLHTLTPSSIMMIPRLCSPLTTTWCANTSSRFFSSKSNRSRVPPSIPPTTTTSTSSKPTLVLSKPAHLKKNLQQQQQLEINQTQRELAPLNESGVQSLFVQNPATLDVRRSAIESRITPPKYEQVRLFFNKIKYFVHVQLF